MSNTGGFGSYDAQGYSSYHAGAPATAQSRDMSNEFGRLSQVIGTNIQKITQNVTQMQRVINQIGSPSDAPELRDKLHQMQHYTNQLAKETSKYLKDLTHLPLPASQSEQRQCKMHRERLMNDFTAVLNNFQMAQRKQKDKERESVQRARTHTTQYDGFSDDKRLDDQLIGSERSAAQESGLQLEADTDSQILQEREQSLRKLEADILDVNQIFKDLGMLVHEQGEVIDSIEANVESAGVNISLGTEQLAQARNYQSKVRRRKLCIIIIVVVVVTILAIIIGVTVTR